MLDDKLKDALFAYTENGATETDCIALIKQAFADEGYAKPEAIVRSFVEGRAMFQGQRVMTGQEWYDRFWKELDGENAPNAQGMNWDQWDYVREAAKRAGGIK